MMLDVDGMWKKSILVVRNENGGRACPRENEIVCEIENDNRLGGREIIKRRATCRFGSWGGRVS